MGIPLDRTLNFFNLISIHYTKHGIVYVSICLKLLNFAAVICTSLTVL